MYGHWTRIQRGGHLSNADYSHYAVPLLTNLHATLPRMVTWKFESWGVANNDSGCEVLKLHVLCRIAGVKLTGLSFRVEDQATMNGPTFR